MYIDCTGYCDCIEDVDSQPNAVVPNYKEWSIR